MLLLAERPGTSWIVDLICQDPAQASGACHRSLQLQELLVQGGYRLRAIDPPPPSPSPALALAGLACGLRDGFYRPLGIDALRNTGLQASRCRALFARHPQTRGLILEGTGYGSLTATAWCRRHGKRAILVPANLESLATYPPVWPYGQLPLLRRLEHEVPWLRQADAVVTISIEEAWLLELLGIQCHHLPYYPPQANLERLRALAAQRRQCQEEPIGDLFVADFGNAPNRTAARRLLAWLECQPAGGPPLHIAGRGSAVIEPWITPALRPRLMLHGEVSDLELTELQRRCRALLILHPATSGMLTRVIDAALADLPVVGDWMTFKSYHHCFADGLLPSAVPLRSASPRPTVIQPPAPPRQAEQRVLELLSQ
jgi:hypothetical protein